MKTRFTAKKIITICVGLSLILMSGSALAQQESIPELPAPIKTLVDQGAQIRFLGKDYGLEGWVAIKNGQEQYFYVLPGQKVFLTGILFDETGKPVTVEQVRHLRDQGEDVLDTLAADNTEELNMEKEKKYEFKTPSEQLFWDIENSNWIPVGLAGTPIFYAFINPQCPHCHDMMAELKEKYIDSGRAQVRLIPVGTDEQSVAQAAFLLASPDPAGTWWKHMSGAEGALPAKQGINAQGVERNLAVMQSWKLSATPLVVYRGKDGTVKIIRGKPKDLESLVSDLGARI